MINGTVMMSKTSHEKYHIDEEKIEGENCGIHNQLIYTFLISRLFSQTSQIFTRGKQRLYQQSSILI